MQSRGFHSAGRGRGRGRGRGGFARPPRDLHPVPSKSQVRPGAAVSIVLKQDQPTGREVQGRVRDVLTSGDHPRGIKVRLADGRVGRVQRMVDDGAAATGAAADVDAGQETGVEGQGIQVINNAATREGDAGRGQRLRYRDVRLDDEMEKPPEALDLAAYIKPAKAKKGAKKKVEEDAEEVAAGQESSTTTCPVCGEFEGDESAVNHHVATHFD